MRLLAEIYRKVWGREESPANTSERWGQSLIYYSMCGHLRRPTGKSYWGDVTVYVTLVTWSFRMVKSRVPYEISSVPSDVVW